MVASHRRKRSTLQPLLRPHKTERMGQTMNLAIAYAPESDTLDLGNGLAGSDGQQVADRLTVFFDEDEVVGITLENATEVLAPLLQRLFAYREELLEPAQMLRDEGEPIS